MRIYEFVIIKVFIFQVSCKVVDFKLVEIEFEVEDVFVCVFVMKLIGKFIFYMYMQDKINK